MSNVTRQQLLDAAHISTDGSAYWLSQAAYTIEALEDQLFVALRTKNEDLPGQRKVLEQALEAMQEAQKYAHNIGKYLHGIPQAITAIQEILK